MNQAVRILQEVKKAVVGKDEVLARALLAILARGHILLEDIPGVGKTTMALAFSRALSLDYNRVQFTPDVMPSDITGFSLYNKETGKMEYQPGAALEVCPAPIPAQTEEKLCAAALRVYETLGLSVYSRADFIVTSDGEPWFLEINTLPGMTPTSLLPQEAAAVGIDYQQLCQRIVEASLEARRQGR